MNILLTAFKDTSAEKLINSLQSCDKLYLDNHREKSVEQLADKLKSNTYSLILSFGQRPLIKDKIHFESTAKNKNGDRYLTDFNIDNALTLCKEIGIAAKRSDNAGTSYCNNIYYYGMEHIKSNSLKIQMCFVHIPFEKNISDFVVFANMVQKLINAF
ncbi:MAG: hypothetical protein NC203_08245 [Firmicutes bacterium]|nr:hypothetical protein [[Eubacterium] siraeum]MCM1488340.1 hypothetical protein [Bacillota bacterium]